MSREVYVVYIDDPGFPEADQHNNLRRDFIISALWGLDQSLQVHGSKLIYIKGEAATEIPRLVKILGCEAVFFNREYEPKRKRRDQKMVSALTQKNVDVFIFKDQVVFEGHELLKKDKKPYRVFTPYYREWLSRFNLQRDCPEMMPQLVRLGRDFRSVIQFLPKMNLKNNLQDQAEQSLQEFLVDIHRYHEQRDFPAIQGTSKMSAHLRYGTISIRQLIREVLKKKQSQGAQIWLKELIWREFYHMILDQFPHVEKTTFLPEYQHIQWSKNKKLFNAWCIGETGYPLVDAAMKQLLQEGWMHNRLRMVVASFLVKDLLLPWQWGEAYFAEKLVDFDLAHNNGGWQWSASTGCDAQPYFRIFNPTEQSKRFDPNGEFIKTYLPSKRNLSKKEIHQPDHPIVDHAEQRAVALRMYQDAKNKYVLGLGKKTNGNDKGHSRN